MIFWRSVIFCKISAHICVLHTHVLHWIIHSAVVLVLMWCSCRKQLLYSVVKQLQVVETIHIRQKDKNISGYLVPIRVRKTSPGLRQAKTLVGTQRTGWIVRTGTLERNKILNDIRLSVGWHFVHIVMWMSLHMKPYFLSLTKTRDQTCAAYTASALTFFIMTSGARKD